MSVNPAWESWAAYFSAVSSGAPLEAKAWLRRLDHLCRAWEGVRELSEEVSG